MVMQPCFFTGIRRKALSRTAALLIAQEEEAGSVDSERLKQFVKLSEQSFAALLFQRTFFGPWASLHLFR